MENQDIHTYSSFLRDNRKELAVLLLLGALAGAVYYFFSFSQPEQIKPFDINFHLNERVEVVKKINDKWIVKTNKDREFETPNIIIAGGVGSFEPRKSVGPHP